MSSELKAVIYHADAHRAKKWSYFSYKDLILGLKENINSYGIKLIHLTLHGFEGYGDENYFYDGVPDEITYNRVKCNAEFLKNQAEDNVQYWFTEPDMRLRNPFPLLLDGIDAAFVVYKPEQRFIPTWSLAKKTAVSLYEESVSNCVFKRWDGDTDAWGKIYKIVNSPAENTTVAYKGLNIETRDYKSYNMSGSKYTAHYKAKHKQFLLENNHLFINPEFKNKI